MKNLRITVNGIAYDVQVEEMGGTSAPIPAAPAPVAVPAAAPAAVPAPAAAPAPTQPVPAGGNTVEAPMPGSIIAVNVTVGKPVSKGDVLVILEAMKMENEITAAADGVVTAVHVNKGDSVETGSPLLTLQ